MSVGPCKEFLSVPQIFPVETRLYGVSLEACRSIGSPDITRGSVAACIQERGDRAPCHQRITMPKGEPSPDARFFGSPPLSPWPRLTSQCTHRRRSVRFSCRRRPR